MNKKLLFALLTLTLSPLPLSADTLKGDFSLSSGATFTSGEYGSDNTTEMLYIPVTLKYKQDKWKVKLTIPYIKIKGPQNVVREIGQVSQNVLVNNATNEGLGDINLSVGYQVFYSPKTKTLLDLTGKVKFGTADENRNLGTGENDFSLALGVYKLLGDFTPYATIGRKLYGDSDRIELDDVFFGSLGLSYKLSQTSSAGVNLYLKEKTASTRSSTRQASAYVSYKLDSDWKLQAYVIGGLSDNTPDLGGGFSLGYQFN